MLTPHLNKAQQWTEIAFVILMLDIALHGRPFHPAVPESYGWLWRGLTASLSFIAKGHTFF